MTMPTFPQLFGWKKHGPLPVPADPALRETILVLEDDETMRDIAALILERAGYRVVSAGTGEAAIEIAQSSEKLHLLLSDVVLPGISGPEAAIRIQALRPAIRTLFMSGYGDEVLRQYDTPVSQTGFLQKPFTPELLLAKVKRLLDRRYTEVARRDLRREKAAEAMHSMRRSA